MAERTLILVKPDAFARNLTGEIISRFERKGLRLAALKLETLSRETAQRHYAEHEGKPFFGELVEFITSGPLVAMVLEGEAAGEPALTNGDAPAAAASSPAERRAERRAAERRAASSARTAAGRPRPAP